MTIQALIFVEPQILLSYLQANECYWCLEVEEYSLTTKYSPSVSKLDSENWNHKLSDQWDVPNSTFRLVEKCFTENDYFKSSFIDNCFFFYCNWWHSTAWYTFIIPCQKSKPLQQYGVLSAIECWDLHFEVPVLSRFHMLPSFLFTTEQYYRWNTFLLDLKYRCVTWKWTCDLFYRYKQTLCSVGPMSVGLPYRFVRDVWRVCCTYCYWLLTGVTR